MKITKTIFIGKHHLKKLKENKSIGYQEIMIYDTRGREEDWTKESWPPVKAKITLETE